jgi:hypothetical protein
MSLPEMLLKIKQEKPTKQNTQKSLEYKKSFWNQKLSF